MNALKTDQLSQIRLLLLDVDGVLTDGSITYTAEGTETKTFNVRDGLGIRLLTDAGVTVGIVTGRASPALRHRCENLGITCVFDGVKDKAAVLATISARTGISPEQTAFMGDDLPDLPLMRRVGLAIAVSDAHPTVIRYADMVTGLRGGYGAVREVCEAILKARGIWEEIRKQFVGP